MTEEAKAPTKVFISYSWDSEDHKERVLALANTLRNPWGIETDIDQYVKAKPPFTPSQGWDLWMEKRLEWAEFVLIVCTETYNRRFRGDEAPGIGRGSTWEGTIIRQNLYNNQSVNTKFIPVVFSSQDLTHVPIILNGNDKYILEDERSFGELCYRLRKEPIVAMPEVATAELPEPPEPKFFLPQKPQAEPQSVFLDIAEIQDQTTEKRETEPEKPSINTRINDCPSYSTSVSNGDDLSSEKGIDYTVLQALLKAKRWKQADQETYTVMDQVLNKSWSFESLRSFPCIDLCTLDCLWTKYSNGRFGFSVQRQIYLECGGSEYYYFVESVRDRFCERVGWQREAGLIEYLNPFRTPLLDIIRVYDHHAVRPIRYDHLGFSLDEKKGHLPIARMKLALETKRVRVNRSGYGNVDFMTLVGIRAFARRLVECGVA